MIRNTLALCEMVIQMRNKPGAAVLAEMAARFAHEPQRDDDSDDGGIPEAVVLGIAKSLLRRGPGAVRHTRLLAQALEAMADACMEKCTEVELEDAADDATDALSKLLED
jgi:hypothetical protein